MRRESYLRLRMNIREIEETANSTLLDKDAFKKQEYCRNLVFPERFCPCFFLRQPTVAYFVGTHPE
jgi:hypothetical protein